MAWCSFCAQNCTTVHTGSHICCSTCGKVIMEDNFSNEPTFVKNSAGQSQLSGTRVRSVGSDYSASRDRILRDAHENIEHMANTLSVHGVVVPAVNLYRIALERNFTRGRRKELVEAACLYISCRENKKPVLLIEFSDFLKINVYVLGAVFLQLCKLLSLEEHPIVQKPVDPSLFIDKFTERLLGEGHKDISTTALRIIAGMKRDWMQTGRKPSGLCGAALYISSHSHKLKCSKSDIVKIVHICEATLTKRLIEFENTDSGSLTIEEFLVKAEEADKVPHIWSRESAISELLCEHKGSGKPPFAHGLCKSCYDDFVNLSGGLEGGSEPPAFQRAEQERMMKESVEFEKKSQIPAELHFAEPEDIVTSMKNAVTGGGSYDTLHGVHVRSATACDEPETLSDIDDDEVDGYLHNEEEKQYKKIIWEEMNREYLEEQAAKEAAAKAAKEAYLANFHGSPEEMQAAQELATAAAAAVAKSRKERQQKRAADARHSLPAQTAAEATREMLTRKRLSSKINYDVLNTLFDDSVDAQDPKKSKTETDFNNDGDVSCFSKRSLRPRTAEKMVTWF